MHAENTDIHNERKTNTQKETKTERIKERQKDRKTDEQTEQRNTKIYMNTQTQKHKKDRENGSKTYIDK